MSDKMTCMPFSQLMEWIRAEHDTKGTVFGVHRPYKADASRSLTIFGRNLETVIGPAAGPNSQLAQNIAASYYAGARFFELKTVQIMDGDELAACVNKPCIKADDECYNCEWSTELYVPQAQEEYIKAWFLLSFMAKEYGLGSMDGFQFNISVGYDLAGIKSPKIDHFIESMKYAGHTDTFRECRQYLLEHAEEFGRMTAEDIEAISPDICNSATISTLHGCPPQEIESIADYLLKEKRMHTFIKCNPTLLGYDFARATLDKMGYDYVAFGRFHFEDDLQYADAVPMLKRLMKLSASLGLEFGVKITNTFPVDVKAGELPSEEMYMSGKSLYPLSISLAAKLSQEFAGRLRIAYSGGADAFNIERIARCGVWPVTVATTILKPGGYQRLLQMAEVLDDMGMKPFDKTDTEGLIKTAQDAVCDRHHMKPAKMPVSRKSSEKVPLLDCYTAPCEDACPIHQEVSTYMRLSGEGRYEEAMQVILNENALPFITGTICAHGCMSHCTRNFYESPVQIRDTKLLCAGKAYEAALSSLEPAKSCGRRAAVVGGGPSGMAAAFYMARAGVQVTIYEKRPVLGGIVSSVIPDFRIDDTVIAKDVSFLEKLGVEIKCNTQAPPVSELKRAGYDSVILAVGAYKRSSLKLEGGTPVNALAFLEEFNETKGTIRPGRNVVVIGGGNTAMDTARAVVRCPGVEHVYLVYRRTKRYMPADEHELLQAVADGVEFRELLAPARMEKGALICRKTTLGAPDASGRAGVRETEETEKIPADMVIAAVGEKVPADYYEENGICVDEKGRPKVDSNLGTNVPGVYVIGDGLNGPSLVVKGMADAKTAAEAAAGKPVSGHRSSPAVKSDVYARKGILAEPSDKKEAQRCLSCSTVCENCVDVCPNRANISVHVPGMEKEQVIHVDYMCNECGNCRSFCPYDSAPYLDKFTLFAKEADMEESKNDGFAVTDQAAGLCRVRYLGRMHTVNAAEAKELPEGIARLIETILKDYTYLISS
ncbi:putative selenate reductase subunit YgfK [[Clostridium] hylemonae]|uniref:putative selenate reductase subunit YgfK n=1 Tax=[Clostridium] hylemonae TaxID=89153 RepID=UPI001FCBB215|nr:putative selenate reductase subunit YgfK [[Clostridium] hylemonae]BDF04081.1 putative selenate reductase subunit YgfK [[Clostridium] hylemonae]